MATYILTYNPSRGDWPQTERDEIMRATAQGQKPEDRWSTGVRNSGIAPGDHWWMFQQGQAGRGLLASGRFLSDCYQDEHWSHDGELANYADIAFDVLLSGEDLLPIEAVAAVSTHVDWQHMQGSGVHMPDDDAAAVQELWAAHLGQPSPPAPGPMSQEDARRRVWAEVRRRQGQPAFRGALLQAYEGACAVTGCTEANALEAAHISPYRGPHSNRVDNGLLLRADVHTLFDLGLLAVADDRTVLVSSFVTEPSYRALAGQVLRLPKRKADQPSKTFLAEHRATFRG